MNQTIPMVPMLSQTAIQRRERRTQQQQPPSATSSPPSPERDVQQPIPSPQHSKHSPLPQEEKTTPPPPPSPKMTLSRRRQSRISNLFHAIVAPEDTKPIHTWEEKKKWPARPASIITTRRPPPYPSAGTGWRTSTPLPTPSAWKEASSSSSNDDDDEDDDDDDDDDNDDDDDTSQGDGLRRVARVCRCCSDESSSSGAAPLLAPFPTPGRWTSVWDGPDAAGGGGGVGAPRQAATVAAVLLSDNSIYAEEPAVAATAEWQPACAVVWERRAGGAGERGGVAREWLTPRGRGREGSGARNCGGRRNGKAVAGQRGEGVPVAGFELTTLDDAILGDTGDGAYQESTSRLVNAEKDIGGAKGMTSKRNLGQWVEGVSSTLKDALPKLFGKHGIGEAEHGKELISK